MSFDYQYIEINPRNTKYKFLPMIILNVIWTRHRIWSLWRACIKIYLFLNRFYVLYPIEIIRSLRESLHNDLYIDSQKKHFELLVQNPQNLSLKFGMLKKELFAGRTFIISSSLKNTFTCTFLARKSFEISLKFGFYAHHY